jgi:hypothetical protein|tara:strand:- start:2282 stop:2458 length:177 start_codon:yes stop_codon:yes gene_type:complete
MSNVVTPYQKRIIEMARQIYETNKYMGIPMSVNESLKQAEDKLAKLGGERVFGGKHES